MWAKATAASSQDGARHAVTASDEDPADNSAYRNEPYNVFSAQCPSRRLLNDVTRRWSTLILATLRIGPHRFNELGVSIQGISERMLSMTLKTLEQDRLVRRREITESSGQQCTQYELTASGSTIASCLESLFSSIYTALDQQERRETSSNA